MRFCPALPRAFAAGAFAALLAACGGTTDPAPTPAPVFVPVVTTVTVSPATASLTVGGTTTLTATVADQRGGAMSGTSVIWSTSTATVATVTASGVVTAVAAGTATITATASGKSGTATITVTAQNGGPTGEFQTTVPPIALNVILGRPTASAVTASVFSDQARDVTITWTPNGGTRTVSLTGGLASNIDLTGLAADQAYQYTVTSAGATPVTGRFRTARPRGSTYRVVMQADSHLDNNSDVNIYKNTLANMVADSADFLMDLGDTFMTDKYPSYLDAAPQYYAQRYYFGLIGATTPAYLVQGNHDGEVGWLTTVAPWSADRRLRYFPPVRNDGFYTSALAARNWYAWTWGDATYVVLDPYMATITQPSKAGNNWAWTLGKEQYDWLAQTLAANTSKYTFVFLHNLVGGSTSEARGGVEASYNWEWGGANADGSNGFATQRAGWAKPIHDLFVQYKVSAVFHGHDHLYVYQQRDGVVYQEVPQPSFARENQTSSAVDYGYLSGVLQASSGHLRLTVSPSKTTVEYIRSRIGTGNGSVVHSYTINPAVRP